MGSLTLSDLIGTLKTSFNIGKATVNTAALTVARTITLPDSPVDLTGAQGSFFYRSASGVVALAPGTAGQFLRTNGAGADPTWEAMSVAITRTASTTSSSGNTTVIAAQGAGNKIAVYAYALQAAGTVTAKLTDGTGGTAQTLPWILQAREGANVPNGGQPLWVGTANTALVLNLTAAIATGYEISWAVTL